MAVSNLVWGTSEARIVMQSLMLYRRRLSTEANSCTQISTTRCDSVQLYRGKHVEMWAKLTATHSIFHSSVHRFTIMLCCILKAKLLFIWCESTVNRKSGVTPLGFSLEHRHQWLTNDSTNVWRTERNNNGAIKLNKTAWKAYGLLDVALSLTTSGVGQKV